MAVSSPALLELMRKAVVLQRDGKVTRARALYEKILKKDPDNPEATNLLGLCFVEQNYPKRAAMLFERAIQLTPGEPRYHINLSDCLEQQDDLPGALAAIETALHQVVVPELLHKRAIVLRRLGQSGAALAAYDAAVRADPDNAELLIEFGQALHMMEKYDEAIRVLEFARQSAPNHRDAILCLADALNLMDRAGDAKQLLIDTASAFEIKTDGLYSLSLANSHWGCGEHASAVIHADTAIALGHGGADSFLVRGKSLFSLGRFPDAIAALEQARALDPNRHETLMTLGFAYLANGDLTNGWRLSEHRAAANTKGLITRRFERPPWQGDSLRGRRLMIWDDQGIGDVLRSASMFADLCERADDLIIECHPKIVALLARNFPEARVRPRQHEARGTLFGADDFDVQCAFGTLPMYLRPTIESFPDHTGYLTADPVRVAKLRQRAPLDGQRPKVGLSWTSRNRSGLRAQSYLSLSDLTPLLTIPDIDFVLLDYTDRSAEIAALRETHDVVLHRWDDLDLFDDLESAAALTACMDLVISANTSVADMAGALGVATWRFGPVTGTVLLGQDNPPWHPATRYLRLDPQQPAHTLVPTLVTELRTWLDARR